MIRHQLKIEAPFLNNVLVIDGKYLCYRSQYSRQLGELTYENVKTHLYYGFFNTIRALIVNYQPLNLVIMWDNNKSVRKEEFKGYKKNRNNYKYLKPEQIFTLKTMQKEYPNIVDLCQNLGFGCYNLDGYEADDLIAMFVKRFTELNKIIITRDEDMYQLIDQTTSLYSPDDKITKNLKWFRYTYRLEPKQWALVKAYGGCKSDTIPGIRGVAEKTAIKIIKGYPKAIEKLENADQDELKLWKRLTVLPHPDLKDMRIPYKMTNINIKRLYELCYKYNFRSLIERMHHFEQLR
jgi:5'-3' exonuclease